MKRIRKEKKAKTGRKTGRKTGKSKSFQFKLMGYFIFFTAVIFTVLWLLQTVFLQKFYNKMLIKRTEKIAEELVEKASDSDFLNQIDDLTKNNSMLVYVTDKSGNIQYSSDAFSNIHTEKQKSNTETFSESSLAAKGQGLKQKSERKSYRELPQDYSSFLEKLESDPDGKVNIESDEMYVYGSYITLYNSSDQSVLYLGTSFNAVGSTVSIIRVQLLWVTFFSVIIGGILAWFLSSNFSTPISQLNKKAYGLLNNKEDYAYKKGFCSELDDLNETLDTTAEKLKQAREFQNELLANVSHDLRTPLTMIKGYAEMIRDISRLDQEQCQEDLAVIIKEADRLTGLVNEILEYSELTSFDAPAKLDDCNLSQLTKRCFDKFKNLYEKDGYTFEVDIGPDLVIKADESKLERAVFNLMDNAVRHAGQDKWIGLILKDDGQNALISISDHGDGIPEDQLDQIWDRYFTKRQRKNKDVSGLGLAIVKKTVDLHKGTCQVTSKPGQGSTFSILLKKDLGQN